MNPPIPSESFDAIIFDLGGVILPLFPQKTTEALSKLFGTDASVGYTQTNQSALFDRFERGEVGPAEFRSQLCEDFGRHASDAGLDEAWNAMLGSLPLAHLDFLLRLKESKRTLLLSNTNEIHITQFLKDYERDHPGRTLPFSSHFEQVYYSHDLGMRKPEPRIFRRLIANHTLSPERTVFLDDSEANVRAASSVGLVGIHHPTNAPLVERFPGV